METTNGAETTPSSIEEGDSAPTSDEHEITTASEAKPPLHEIKRQKVKKGRAKRRPKKYVIKEDYCDIIKDAFWEAKPWILG